MELSMWSNGVTLVAGGRGLGSLREGVGGIWVGGVDDTQEYVFSSRGLCIDIPAVLLK